MKLRIGPELRRQLAIVKLHGFSAADAVNCAARRWERYGKPDLSEAEAGTTYAGMDADAVRRLLAWYFRNWPARPPRYQFDPGKLTEGKDYTIAREE